MPEKTGERIFGYTLNVSCYYKR